MPRPRPTRRRVDGGEKRWKAIVVGGDERKRVRGERFMKRAVQVIGDFRC
jgi:hypothetical protein